MKPHEILGLPETATDEEIRKAYKRLAMRLHPDRGGDADEFTRLQKAYSTLQNRICPVCQNKGHVSERQGAFVTKKPCPRCWNTTD